MRSGTCSVEYAKEVPEARVSLFNDISILYIYISNSMHLIFRTS
jgi:hypothetical protein